jgi:hypothetical protein
MMWEEGAGDSALVRALLEINQAVKRTLSFLLCGRRRVAVWIGITILAYLIAPIFGGRNIWGGAGVVLIYAVLACILGATQWLERKEQRREDPI